MMRAHYRERTMDCHKILVCGCSGADAHMLLSPVVSCLSSVPHVSTSDRSCLEETSMAENEKEAYLALIAAHDPEIRALLDHGFAFVTNAFKAGAAPSG